MRPSHLIIVVAAVTATACGSDRGDRALAHRGFAPGMPVTRFRQAAESIGPLECGPFRVAGVAADQLCATSNAQRGLRVVAALGAADSAVPYLVVQEADSAGGGFAALTREWGAPDTLVETGRRWRRGRWVADADTVGGRLTVWLTDTATEARIARQTIAAARALTDTTPVHNVLQAVLDTIRSTSPAGAAPPASPVEVDTPPGVLQCRQSPVPAPLERVSGSVTLMYVVDSTGRAEPASIRVLDATRSGFISAAVTTIGSCRFQPGRKDGKPVRVLVQQRVGFKGNVSQVAAPGGKTR